MSNRGPTAEFRHDEHRRYIYAEALLAIARPGGTSAALLGEQVEELLEALQSLVGQRSPSSPPSWRARWSSPDDAAKAIEKLCRGRASDVLVNALQVMNRKGRMTLIPEVTERYRLALEALRNEVDVHVTSAVPLNDAALGRAARADDRELHRAPASASSWLSTSTRRCSAAFVVQIEDLKIRRQRAFGPGALEQQLRIAPGGEIHPRHARDHVEVGR